MTRSRADSQARPGGTRAAKWGGAPSPTPAAAAAAAGSAEPGARERQLPARRLRCEPGRAGAAHAGAGLTHTHTQSRREGAPRGAGCGWRGPGTAAHGGERAPWGSWGPPIARPGGGHQLAAHLQLVVRLPLPSVRLFSTPGWSPAERCQPLSRSFTVNARSNAPTAPPRNPGFLARPLPSCPRFCGSPPAPQICAPPSRISGSLARRATGGRCQGP